MLYALPSLALFVVLIPYTGLTDTTVIIPLTAVLAVRAGAERGGRAARRSRSTVRQAATAMGFGTLRRLVQVELPIAVPIVIAGLRVAVVSSISLASVGQLIGVTSLGYLIIDGYQRDFPDGDLRGRRAHHRARPGLRPAPGAAPAGADPVAAAPRRRQAQMRWSAQPATALPGGAA